jgi:ATP-dependent helicase/nuclease subunit B
LNGNRLSPALSQGLAAGATIICASAQRQASLRAAWADAQRAAGRELWRTPRIFTFTQFAERSLGETWARAQLPDRLLPPGAEWAVLREMRRDSGGNAEARALHNAIRALGDWRITRAPSALGGSPEGEWLLAALARVAEVCEQRGRKPLREWLAGIEVPQEDLLAVGTSALATAPQEALRRWQARMPAGEAAAAHTAITCAEDDDHELELIAAWAHAQLQRDPRRRLLVVDAKLRQRRGLYDRILSQTLTPSEWVDAAPRGQSAVFTIEGGRPLAEFPLIAHALLSLRLLTGRLRFDEVVHWLRLPFLDGEDHFAGSAVEALLRKGRQLELSAETLARELERGTGIPAVAMVAARLRLALETLAGERRTPAEWSPRLLLALRQLGWHGARPLRSDEQQTVARWHALLDEYAALGAWLPRASAADAVATLADLAGERNFDPASVEAPLTLTDSHDDPVIRYDAIWVAGLDSAQWPPAPRPDVFIPLRLQVAAGIPWASALGQAQAARRNLAAWRAAAGELTLSWARMEGDAHRAISPMLARLDAATTAEPVSPLPPLAARLRQPGLEALEDVQGAPVDTRQVVKGGVTPLTLQAECGFHAYAQVRLLAGELETPAPGLDPRERGMLLHKALELVWIKLKDHFHLKQSEGLRAPLIADSVEAAVASVFRGYVPTELRQAVDREKHRLETLIEALLQLEQRRSNFDVVALEARREVSIAGGRFEVRIDRIDALEGGGQAILDYKSGDARAPRWRGTDIRDPQLLTYLLAERGRNVQALVNVALANNRARFAGRSSRIGLLLPAGKGVSGLDSRKVPPDQIDAAWQAELDQWLQGLFHIATEYVNGHAPVQPAADVCRHCHLTILCRRVELAHAELDAAEGEA